MLPVKLVENLVISWECSDLWHFFLKTVVNLFVEDLIVKVALSHNKITWIKYFRASFISLFFISLDIICTYSQSYNLYFSGANVVEKSLLFRQFRALMLLLLKTLLYKFLIIFLFIYFQFVTFNLYILLLYI
jgi:hypothetical protein